MVNQSWKVHWSQGDEFGSEAEIYKISVIKIFLGAYFWCKPALKMQSCNCVMDARGNHFDFCPSATRRCIRTSRIAPWKSIGKLTKIPCGSYVNLHHMCVLGGVWWSCRRCSDEAKIRCMEDWDVKCVMPQLHGDLEQNPKLSTHNPKPFPVSPEIALWCSCCEK